MSELWKPIPDYQNYEVSNLGNVRSLKSNKVLKPLTRSHGYLAVFLYKKGCGEHGKQYSVHRLVAEAFCEKPEGKNEVNHLNENKQDNRAENLMWCTKQENCSYGNRGAIISRKNTNGKRSKPVRQYTQDGEFIKEYPSFHEASRQTGIPVSNIHHATTKSQVAYGYRWGYAV